MTPDLGAVREWLANSPLAPPCELAELRVFSGKVYAACGSDGLLVIAAGPVPELVEQRDLGGSVVELFEKDGELCARVLKSTSAVVVANLPPPAQTFEQEAQKRHQASPPPPEKAKPRRRKRHPDGWGRVVDENNDEIVIVDLGLDDGVEVGDRIVFASTEAVGEVRAVAKRRARVLIGQNERAPLRSAAHETLLPVSASNTAPPRAYDFTSLSLLLRPFLGLDSTGGGIVIDAAVSHRWAAPFKLSAALAPFGYGGVGGRSATTLSGYVLPSYDTHLFEAGVGLGVQTVNATRYVPGTGTLVPFLVRLGASDGLSLTGRVDVTLFHQTFFATGARVELAFPVARGNWLLLNGAGGVSGYSEFEAGLRTQVRGNGHRGSHYITVVVGGSEVRTRTCVSDFTGSLCFDDPSTSGAHFGVGFESRL